MKGKATMYRACKTIFAGIAILLLYQKVAAQDARRLIAEVTYANDSIKYTLSDSISYVYGGTRTSNAKTGQHLYDTATYSTTPAAQPAIKYSRTYDIADRISKHTTQQYLGTGWRNSRQSVYKYLIGNRYDTVWNYTWDTTNLVWNTKRIYVYKYTSSGKQDSIYWLKPSGANFVTEAVDVYRYTDSLLTQHTLDVWNDTLLQWDRWQQEVYHYDAIGKADTYWNYTIDIPTITLQPERKEVIVYDANKRIAGLWRYYWFTISQSWQGLNEYYYTYNTHGDIIQEVVNYWDLFVQMWGPQSKIYYYYDFTYNLTDAIEKRFDNPVFADYAWVKWLYNSSGLPVEKTSYMWNDVIGGWLPEKSNASKKMYYYEANSGIVAGSEKNDDWMVYPNPAASFIIIKAKGNVNTGCRIALSDMQGRHVREWNEGAGTTYNLQVQGIPNGQYLLHIIYGSEEMTKLLIIANQ